MANLDTPLKRASSVQLLLWEMQAPPLPTGTIGTLVRQALSHCYAGITAAFSGTSILLQMLMHHEG
jgi:hypothetical protein